MNSVQEFELLEEPKAQRHQDEAQRASDRDNAEMSRLGKKQVLKRNFGFMSMVGFSCTMMVTWEAILMFASRVFMEILLTRLSVFLSGFENGGPAGLVYGYLLVWVGALSVFIILSELASMASTSGGQYHWVFILASESMRKYLSYLTGWLTATGWQASVASGGYLSGTLIQGMIVLNHPEYNFKQWHGTLLFWVVILVAVFVNTIISSLLPKLEGLILIIHVLGFFAVLIPLVYMASHGSSSSVFSNFINEGGWSTQGVSFFVGIIGNVFAFLGSDGTIHMSEEIRNASTIVPYSLITSLMLNGILGLGMLIAVLFCLGDVEAALDSPTKYPFMEIFFQATGSVPGSTAMIAIITVLQICAAIACLAGSSRMTWSFARDHGLPGWRYLSKVDPRSSIPTTSIAFTTAIACFLGLINIGSSTAFNDVISLTVGGLYTSYIICSVLLLWRRLTGTIEAYRNTLDETREPGAGPHLRWGPFRIPGYTGIAVNFFGIMYMIVILFFSFWPPTTPTKAETMNYSVAVLGSVVIFSTIYYTRWAHKTYKGPVIEIDH